MTFVSTQIAASLRWLQSAILAYFLGHVFCTRDWLQWIHLRRNDQLPHMYVEKLELVHTDTCTIPFWMTPKQRPGHHYWQVACPQRIEAHRRSKTIGCNRVPFHSTRAQAIQTWKLGWLSVASSMPTFSGFDFQFMTHHTYTWKFHHLSSANQNKKRPGASLPISLVQLVYLFKGLWYRSRQV